MRRQQRSKGSCRFKWKCGQKIASLMESTVIGSSASARSRSTIWRSATACMRNSHWLWRTKSSARFLSKVLIRAMKQMISCLRAKRKSSDRTQLLNYRTTKTWWRANPQRRRWWTQNFSESQEVLSASHPPPCNHHFQWSPWRLLGSTSIISLAMQTCWRWQRLWQLSSSSRMLRRLTKKNQEKWWNNSMKRS